MARNRLTSPLRALAFSLQGRTTQCSSREVGREGLTCRVATRQVPRIDASALGRRMCYQQLHERPAPASNV